MNAFIVFLLNAFIVFLLIGITCAVYDLLVVVPLTARLIDDDVVIALKILTFVLPPVVVVFAVSTMVISQFGAFRRLSGVYNKFYNAVAET